MHGSSARTRSHQESVGETKEVWCKFRRKSWVQSERASEGIGQ